MTNVKVFVHATDADTDADTRVMTLARQTYVPARQKFNNIFAIDL